MNLYGYGPSLIAGTQMTLLVSVCALAVALIMGLLGAWGKLSDSRLARGLAETYTIVIRGIPELVLLLLIYWGSQQLIQDTAAYFGSDIRVNLPPFTTGVFTIGFIYGAFATEVFRGALQAIPKGQIEAARAIGMSRVLTFRRIMFPQMWRFALPGIGNVWLVLIKATALISLIHLEELMRKTGIAVGVTKKPFTFYFVAALIYLAITTVSIVVLRYLERRANRGIRHAF